MDITLADFLTIDLPAMLVGTLAAVPCALLGNFLVLRRQALIGDALSHVVLPGIVVGFMISGSVGTVPMMAGALGAALVAVVLIELIRRLGRLETGAAMGVVFTVMFAAGVVMLERGVGSRVHLDAHHALYGAVELTYWRGPTDWASLLDPGVWAALPRSIAVLAAATTVIAASIALFYKELKITTFDPGLATSLGIRASWVNAGLILMVAVAAVAAFEAVGSILVIAMFICPPATARMLTDRLSRQIALSALVAALSGVFGYVFAAFVPLWLGGANSLTAAGMIAVVAGVFQLLAMLFALRYGAVTRMLGQRRHRSGEMPPMVP
ncbi:MAG TPA: metal ABC transporter permease [Alphaproteobacteria bacterium]|nr:metal ABC transporter permease [Alphaproteobacteria bacterium]